MFVSRTASKVFGVKQWRDLDWLGVVQDH